MTNRGLIKGTGTIPLSLDNKRLARTADPRDAQDVQTRNAARGSLANAPYYFPATASGRWDQLVSMYGWKQEVLHKIRAALKKSATSGGAGTPLNVFFLGDSTLIGYNGTSYNADRAIPRQFGLALSYMLGGIPYVDGVRQAVVALTAPQGDRTVLTGSFLTNAGGDQNFIVGTGAGTITWKSVDRGTTVEFYYSDLSTTGFTYNIDGAGAVAVTTGGTSTIKAKTVSGLSDTPHTLVITQSGASCIIAGWRVFSPGLVQIQCHNLAIGGTKANGSSGGPGGNWSDATTTGLQNSVLLMMGTGAANITPDLVVVCCGNNDVAGSVSPATAESTIQGLINMRAMYPSTPYVFMHPPMVPGSDTNNFDRFSQQLITMIDGMSQACYFPWDDWDGRTQGYVADGLAGADNIHPIDAEAMAVARHLATQLAGPETYSTPMTSQSLIDDVTTSGTSEQRMFVTPIPSWYWRAGTTIRVVTSGTCTSGTSPTIATHTRIGTLGTTGDANVASTSASATVASGAGWRYECELTCRTTGTSGTVSGRAVLMIDGIAPKISTETTAATVNTNVYNYLTFTLTPGGTTPVFVQRQAFFDVPPGP